MPVQVQVDARHLSPKTRQPPHAHLTEIGSVTIPASLLRIGRKNAIAILLASLD